MKSRRRRIEINCRHKRNLNLAPSNHFVLRGQAIVSEAERCFQKQVVVFLLDLFGFSHKQTNRQTNKRGEMVHIWLCERLSGLQIGHTHSGEQRLSVASPDLPFTF